MERRKFVEKWLVEILLGLILIATVLVMNEARGIKSGLDELRGGINATAVRGYVIVRNDGALGVAWAPPRAVSVAPTIAPPAASGAPTAPAGSANPPPQ